MSEDFLVRTLRAEPATEKSDRKTRFVFSTSRYQDGRYGDGYALPPEKADLSRFKRFVWNHRVADMFLGGATVEPEDVLGRIADVKVDGERLVGSVEWVAAELNPKAEVVRKLYESDVMDEVSIRFKIEEENAPTEPERARFKIPAEDVEARVATRWSAWEASAVVIGMDPGAVKLARSRGMLTEKEEELLLPAIPWKAIEARFQKMLDAAAAGSVSKIAELARSLEARLQQMTVSASGARAAQDSARPGRRYEQLEGLLRELKEARAKTTTQNHA